MPPATDTIIGKKPKIKILLVKQATDELEKLINEDWKIGVAYENPNGTIFLLAKS